MKPIRNLGMLAAFAAGLCAGLLTLQPIARAQPAGAPSQATSWHFVQTDKIDYAKILPPPPNPGSLAAEADMMAAAAIVDELVKSQAFQCRLAGARAEATAFLWKRQPAP